MLQAVLKSVGISVFLWLSVCIFLYMLPLLKWMALFVGGMSTSTGGSGVAEEWFHYFESKLIWLFWALWLLPLNLLSRTICVFWFASVSDMVYRMRYGDPRPTAVNMLLADNIYNIFFELFFLLQAVLVRAAVQIVPVLDHAVPLVHYCLIYSLYAFEYKWSNMGLDLRQRLKMLESNWPYFVGFGLPIYALNNVWAPHYQGTASLCVYLATFPFFIVAGTFSSAPSVADSGLFRLRVAAPSVRACNFCFTNLLRRVRPANKR